MTESFNVFEPPQSDTHYGFITGRIIRRVSDTTLDTDTFLDAANVVGSVVFTPIEKVTKTEDYRAILFREPVVAPLDSMGFLTNAAGKQRGIWLTVGYWEVSFRLIDHTLTPFYIEVLETYDESNPLDLADAQPEVLPSSTPRNVISLPSGGDDGDILVKNADGSTRWEHYLLEGVTLDDLRGPEGPEGPVGPVGPSGPAGQLNLSENMLLNGGFELGSLEYWWSGGTLQTTDVPGKDGANRAVTWPAGEKNHGDQTFPSVPVGPSGIYQIDVWLKADTPDSNFYLDLQDQSGQQVFTSKTVVGGGENPYVLQEETLPTSWTKYTRYIRFGDTSLAQANKNAVVMKIAGVHLNHLSGANQNAAVSMGGIWIRPVQQVSISPASIGDTELKDNSITLAKMADASVGTDELINDSVTLEKLLNGSVDTDKLVDKSVTGIKIADRAIGTPQIAAKAITRELLADDISLGGSNGFPFNVKDYGAKGDGVTDDTQAIKNCVTASGRGGSVYFPVGNYVITDQIRMIPNQLWFGLSAGNDNPNSVGTIITCRFKGSSIWAQMGSIVGINFMGPLVKDPATCVGYTCIETTGSMMLRDVCINGFENGILAKSTWYMNTEHVFIRRCLTGVNLDYCYNVTMFNLRYHGTFENDARGYGVRMDRASMATFHGGSIEQYTNGFTLVGNQQSLYLNGTYMETSTPTGNGIALNGGTALLNFQGCQVYLNHQSRWVHAANTGGVGSTIVSIGNKFKANYDATALTYAYSIPTYQNIGSFIGIGDDWTSVPPYKNYQYINRIPGGNSLVLPPAGSMPA